jgi:acetylornithine deacetylase/succinyl-diaminopimelate desuccinylase-like protein
MQDLIKEIISLAQSEQTRQYVADLLLDICRVDTSPFADVDQMRKAENKVFERLEQEFQLIPFAGAYCERRPINPEIKNHPGFSLLYFTKTAENPDGLSPEEVYRDRSNLLYCVPGADGREENGIAVNSHIDVVKPYFPPRLENGIVFGRGACDDKGAVVTMVTALKILAAVLAKAKRRLRRNLLVMCVIEEEPGGNGSLSLAIDRDLKKRYDSILVLECCSNNIHPANRGAIWYQVALTCPKTNLFEMAAFVYEQMELEGRAIKAESRHPLFPQRPVQTCHGQIGPYGEHPSRICGEVAFDICFSGKITPRVHELVADGIASALADYIAVYGDKTKVMDQTTGKAKVDHHFDLETHPDRLVCQVHGSTGHMGSIMENDGAITKMAAFVRILYRMKDQLRRASGGEVSLHLHGLENPLTLLLEGGQGFVPTHDINEVMERMRQAACNGAANYLQLEKRRDVDPESCAVVTYDKLHNAAFDGDPDSPQMRNAIAAGKDAGIWKDGQEITGWTVSCDSRLFAFEYPGMPVLTSGAGMLQYAHSDAEQVKLSDIQDSVAFVASYLLREAGLA